VWFRLWRVANFVRMSVGALFIDGRHSSRQGFTVKAVKALESGIN